MITLADIEKAAKVKDGVYRHATIPTAVPGLRLTIRPLINPPYYSADWLFRSRHRDGRIYKQFGRYGEVGEKEAMAEAKKFCEANGIELKLKKKQPPKIKPAIMSAHELNDAFETLEVDSVVNADGCKRRCRMSIDYGKMTCKATIFKDDGTPIWSAVYEVPTSALLALRSHIVGAINGSNTWREG